MATRWGIVSAGKICNDFVSALKLLSTDEHVVAAVAARDLKRAQEFAKRFNIPRVYGSYEELTKDKEIDVIYIGSIHTMHLPLCKLFIEEGCNVLCEKPLTVNSHQAREIIQLARQKGIFFMEAFWSRFFPIYEDLHKELTSGSIGEPKFVSANFGDNVLGKGIFRLEDKKLAGGGLLDMGCYTIQFVQMVFNHEKPSKIIASGFLNEKSGTDDMVQATFLYSGNRMAVVACSVNCALDNTATIFGSKADNNIIKIENFWNPETMMTPSGKKEHKLPKTDYPLNFRRSEGMMYEAQAVRHCLLNGLKEHPLMTLDQSLQILEIMDEMRQQIGLVYDEDTDAK